ARHLPDDDRGGQRIGTHAAVLLRHVRGEEVGRQERVVRLLRKAGLRVHLCGVRGDLPLDDLADSGPQLVVLLGGSEEVECHARTPSCSGPWTRARRSELCDEARGGLRRGGFRSQGCASPPSATRCASARPLAFAFSRRPARWSSSAVRRPAPSPGTPAADAPPPVDSAPAARIRTASRPAFAAPPTDTVATGTPAGIWTIDSSESIPSRCASGTGTPMTGSEVSEASMPGRCAAPPAPA